MMHKTPMKLRTRFAAALIIIMATCWADQPSASPTLQGITAVTVDSDVVRLPVVDGNDIRFVRLGRSQGLSQQRVTNIAQDEHGFLWFGTQYGLNRYDGYHFRIFKNNPDDPRSLCGVFISSVFVDRAGRLWIGCEYALDRYDPTTETFVHYRLAPSKSAGPAGRVGHISQDRAGILWLSTGDGLYRVDPTTGATARFGHDANPASLSSDAVKSSGEDRAGTFWVATRNGLEALDRVHARVTERVPVAESRDFSFYEDRDGVFWVCYASGNGLAVLDRQTHHLTRYSFGREDFPTHPLTGVSSILQDRDGNLWLGTFSDGLLKFDRKHRRFIRYRNDPSNGDSLPENRITTLFEDREGNVWLGLGATEPAFFPIRQPPFEVLPFASRNPDNLGETLVDIIYEDRAGIVWMGTTGALVRLNRENGELTHFAIPGNGVASDVLAIVEDASGALWIGTSGQGVYRRSATTGRLTAFRHRDNDASSLSDDTVLQLLFDRTGTLWVATMDGLDRFNAASQTFETFRYVRRVEPNVFADIVEDSSGALWLGTPFAGVLRFDRQTQQFVSPRDTQQQNVPGNARVNKLFIDHAGALWAATQNGVDRYDQHTGRITHYSERNGLASNDVSCILEDSSGGLWLGTSSGLSHIDLQRGIVSNYSPADGLPGPDFTGYKACFRNARGEMFFGGFSGAVAFHPERLPDNTYVPPVALTSFQLFGKPVSLGPGSPLKSAISYTDKLSLSHDQNSFSFEFAALSFRNPATNRYRFKLEGLDKYWQEVGSERRYATYTTLPPGEYRFRVQGATIRGRWSEPGLDVPVTIAAPWWARWEFRAIAVAALLAIVFSIYQYRVQRITRTLEIRFEERTRERTRIARDLHDSLLQGIQGLNLKYHALARTMPERSPARSTIEGYVRQARELIEEVRTRVRELRKQDEPKTTLAELLRDFADVVPRASSTVFEIAVVGEERPLDPIALEELLLVAREAISNAMVHADATRVEAELTYRAKELMLRISDDGKGIDSKTLESGRPGHWGLQGMRERARSLGAVLELWSRAGAGTELKLIVPGAVAYGRRRRGADDGPIKRVMRVIFKG